MNSLQLFPKPANSKTPEEKGQFFLCSQKLRTLALLSPQTLAL